VHYKSLSDTGRPSGNALQRPRLADEGRVRHPIRFSEKVGAAVLPDWRNCRVTGPALAAFERPA
jgi:hypothetical protein